jgi:hypothetical protein
LGAAGKNGEEARVTLHVEFVVVTTKRSGRERSKVLIFGAGV